VTELDDALEAFRQENRFQGKGALSLALVLTRKAADQGLPLNAKALVTKGGGQVAGLGGGAVNKLLKEHGVNLVLAEEGGRTNRGSMGHMVEYVRFLNALGNDADLKAIEAWWIERIKDFFAAKPFALKYDPAKSMRTMVRDLLQQAEKRQKERPGTTFAGTVLQHLVGAKLELLLPGKVEHHGASAADEAGGRAGDFLLSDVAIHVTTAPTEALIRKCSENLSAGFRPLVVTVQKRVAMADGLAEEAGIAARLEIFEAEQFLAGNVYELGKFDPDQRRATVGRLVNAYNKIVSAQETDPSLQITIG
jgi:hypothetical protein